MRLGNVAYIAPGGDAAAMAYSSGVPGFTPADVKAALDALAGVRIVEMGSNSNGEYVRWESGLQICWATINVSSITPSTETVQTVTNYHYAYTWTYPATFASAPSCIAKVDTFGARSIETMGHSAPLVSNWRVEVQALKTFSSMHLMLMAIGRWT